MNNSKPGQIYKKRKCLVESINRVNINNSWDMKLIFCVMVQQNVLFSPSKLNFQNKTTFLICKFFGKFLSLRWSPADPCDPEVRCQQLEKMNGWRILGWVLDSFTPVVFDCKQKHIFHQWNSDDSQCDTLGSEGVWPRSDVPHWSSVSPADRQLGFVRLSLGCDVSSRCYEAATVRGKHFPSLLAKEEPLDEQTAVYVRSVCEAPPTVFSPSRQIPGRVASCRPGEPSAVTAPLLRAKAAAGDRHHRGRLPWLRQQTDQHI